MSNPDDAGRCAHALVTVTSRLQKRLKHTWVDLGGRLARGTRRLQLGTDASHEARSDASCSPADATCRDQPGPKINPSMLQPLPVSCGQASPIWLLSNRIRERTEQKEETCHSGVTAVSAGQTAWSDRVTGVTVQGLSLLKARPLATL